MLLRLQHARAGRLHLTLCPTMHSAGTVVSLERRKNNHLTGCCSYYTFNPVEGVSNTIGPHMSARKFE